MPHLNHDDAVKCLANSIDEDCHAGRVGRVGGFARFSFYHPREVLVRFDDKTSGWFWERDVSPQTDAI